MRVGRAAVVVLSFAACGDKSQPAGAAAAGPSSAIPRVTAAWTWGEASSGDASPTGAAFIAAGRGRLVVATHEGCLELLDGATGTPVARRCEEGTAALGLAVVGDVAVLAREKSVHAFALDDLHDLWTRDTGSVHSTDELARPAAVGGRFCFLRSDELSGRGIECLDPATGRPGAPWTVGGVRIAFGDRLIGIITSHRPKSLPYADGLELMVELHAVDRETVAERAMAGRYGPRFVQARPVFVAQTDGERGRTRWIVDRDGRELTGEAAERALAPSPVELLLRAELGAAEPVIDGEMAYAVAGGRVRAYRIAAPP